MSRSKSVDDTTVLEKALLVISERGPETFTLADVSEVVGLSPATLLQRFGSKRKLLIAAAKQANATLDSDLKTLKAKELPWNEELTLLLGGVPEGFGTREDIANSLGLLRLDMVDTELHPIARKLFMHLRGRVKELLSTARELGKLNSNIDLDAMTWELDALRHGLVIQWSLSGKGTLKAWLSQGIHNYLDRRTP